MAKRVMFFSFQCRKKAWKTMQKNLGLLPKKLQGIS